MRSFAAPWKFHYLAILAPPLAKSGMSATAFRMFFTEALNTASDEVINLLV